MYVIKIKNLNGYTGNFTTNQPKTSARKPVCEEICMYVIPLQTRVSGKVGIKNKSGWMKEWKKMRDKIGTHTNAHTPTYTHSECLSNS